MTTISVYYPKVIFKHAYLFLFMWLNLWEMQKENLLKVCVRYFLSNFYFSPNDSFLKTMKNVFHFIWKVLFVLEIFRFLYFRLPLFFSLSAIALEVKSWNFWRHQLSKEERNNLFCLISWEGKKLWHWKFVHW